MLVHAVIFDFLDLASQDKKMNTLIIDGTSLPGGMYIDNVRENHFQEFIPCGSFSLNRLGDEGIHLIGPVEGKFEKDKRGNIAFRHEIPFREFQNKEVWYNPVFQDRSMNIDISLRGATEISFRYQRDVLGKNHAAWARYDLIDKRLELAATLNTLGPRKLPSEDEREIEWVPNVEVLKSICRQAFERSPLPTISAMAAAERVLRDLPGDRESPSLKVYARRVFDNVTIKGYERNEPGFNRFYAYVRKVRSNRG